jgi:formylglycine-generating enzyme required for sulfatase activity
VGVVAASNQWAWGGEAGKREEPGMVFVPAGEFLMGNNDMHPDEQPAHKVYLDAFWIDKTEVTNAQYKAFMEATGHEPPDYESWENPLFNLPDQPVVGVTWFDARDFCQWAGKRLPTEAEWEKAARGTDGRIYPWGNEFNELDLEQEYVNFFTKRLGRANYVGSYPKGASPYGALDMAGNVYEWTNSLYQPYPYNKTDGREDLQAPGQRSVRGGSWYSVKSSLRMAQRLKLAPDFFDHTIGFRCAKDAKE